MDIFSVTDVYILGINFLFISKCNLEKKKNRKKTDCDISQGESHLTTTLIFFSCHFSLFGDGRCRKYSAQG